jgi:hypothetical protein
VSLVAAVKHEQVERPTHCSGMFILIMMTRETKYVPITCDMPTQRVSSIATASFSSHSLAALCIRPCDSRAINFYPAQSVILKCHSGHASPAT